MNATAARVVEAPTIDVQPLTAAARPAWDTFVHAAAPGTFFHLSGWKDVIEQTFGFTTHYLVARRGDAIVGVLPLVELRAITGRRSLLSLPFAVEGGICATDADARAALEAAALAQSRALGDVRIELRDGLDDPQWTVREGLYFRFRRALAAEDEANMAAIPRKQRRMIRVGQKAGLSARVGNEGFEAFYDLYARSVRMLGTPVFPAHYFRRLLSTFGRDCEILSIWHERTPVAAVMSFFFNDTVLPYYAGSHRDYFKHAVNDFMYWELMRHAAARGCRVFDFGRSKRGTGAFDFKSHWGFEPEPLRYRVYGVDTAQAMQRSTSDQRLQWLRTTWQRVPLPITKLIGPFFIRHFGAYYT